MKEFFIVLAAGQDRVGIVSDVSQYLYERNANIEDSHMSTMGGRFILTLLCSGEAKDAQRVRTEANHLREIGLTYMVLDAENPSDTGKNVALPLQIELRAVDHPGIVRRVVQVLQGENVNIEKLDTEVVHTPFSGSPIFNMHVTASIPAGRPVSQIKKELEDLAASENFDLSFPK